MAAQPAKATRACVQSQHEVRYERKRHVIMRQHGLQLPSDPAASTLGHAWTPSFLHNFLHKIPALSLRACC